MRERDDTFVQFVHARSPALMRTAYLLTGDAELARDLLQTALTNMYVAWPRIQSTEALDAYARTSMTRTLISWRRYRGRRPEIVHSEIADRSAVHDSTTDDREEILSCLRRLPPRQRAVIVLRYYEELSEQETASALGCSVGTVKSQASRGLARLKQMMTTAALNDGATLPHQVGDSK